MIRISMLVPATFVRKTNGRKQHAQYALREMNGSGLQESLAVRGMPVEHFRNEVQGDAEMHGVSKACNNTEGHALRQP